VADPALVVELDRLAAGALVDELDPQAAGQERRLAQPLAKRVGVELELLEDLAVRQVRDRRAGVVLFGRADDGQFRLRDAARELLAVDLAVAPDLRDEPLR